MTQPLQTLSLASGMFGKCFAWPGWGRQGGSASHTIYKERVVIRVAEGGSRVTQQNSSLTHSLTLSLLVEHLIDAGVKQLYARPRLDLHAAATSFATNVSKGGLSCQGLFQGKRRHCPTDCGSKRPF